MPPKRGKGVTLPSEGAMNKKKVKQTISRYYITKVNGRTYG